MAFSDFVQIELPKRPFTEVDGAAGQIPVRSTNANKPRELVWVNPSDLGLAGGSGTVEEPTSATYAYDAEGNIIGISETFSGGVRTTVLAYNADVMIETATVTYLGVTTVTTYTYGEDGSITGYTVT